MELSGLLVSAERTAVFAVCVESNNDPRNASMSESVTIGKQVKGCHVYLQKKAHLRHSIETATQMGY